LATATARNVDDKDYAHLSEGAEESGRSISDQLRILIAEYARKREVAKSVARMQEIREQSKGLLGPWPDSVALIRAVRDEE
jgi:hypothetical protein